MTARKYDPSNYPRQAHALCLLGATGEELAAFFQVATSTVETWLKTHPEFGKAVRSGRVVADSKVAKALYRKAIGYKHRATKIFLHEGAAVIVPYTEVYPPDTTACIFWLKNRRRADWRDKVDLGNDPDNPVNIVLNMAGAEAAKTAKK